MNPITLTPEEATYILNAIDMRIQKSEEGIAAARIGLTIVEKLQQALQPPAPSEEDTGGDSPP